MVDKVLKEEILSKSLFSGLLRLIVCLHLLKVSFEFGPVLKRTHRSFRSSVLPQDTDFSTHTAVPPTSPQIFPWIPLFGSRVVGWDLLLCPEVEVGSQRDTSVTTTPGRLSPCLPESHHQSYWVVGSSVDGGQPYSGTTTGTATTIRWGHLNPYEGVDIQVLSIKLS